MRKTVTVIGKGYSEQQAKVTAYNDLKSSYKNNVLVYGMISCVQKAEPKPGNQCTTENNTVTGARKWITKHNVYGVNPNDADDLKLIPSTDPNADFAASKTDALKKAKELALKYQATFIVKVEKELEDGKCIEATVNPKGAKEGEWEIQLDIEIVG